MASRAAFAHRKRGAKGSGSHEPPNHRLAETDFACLAFGSSGQTRITDNL